MKKHTYHGWIVVESSGKNLSDSISVEWTDSNGKRQGRAMELHGNPGCIEAVNWWEKRLNQTIALEPTLKGCYRVYTKEA